MHSFMTINKVSLDGKVLRYDVFHNNNLVEAEIKAQKRVAELHEMGLRDAFYINEADYMHEDVAPCQGIQYLHIDAENKTVTFNVAAFDTDKLNKAMANLRKQRNERLLSSDIVVLPDRWAVMDVDTQVMWTDYRQALRDLPANSVDPVNPIWPSEPGD